MSDLPEWLWPLEDEAAVQEAERLINETHDALKRMEADIQRTLGQHLNDKTEKLKNVVNNKLETLEKELMGISKPTQSATSIRQQRLSHKSEELKISSKSQRNQQKVSTLQVGQPSLLLQKKNPQTRGNASSAEKVVLTARAKVQEALAVARDVSASLEQHTSAPSLTAKTLLRSHTSNVGVFEIKSQRDDKKIQISKPRLEHALLPTISIKGGLERRSIPSVQVLPGEKIVPHNVSMCNIQHCDDVKTTKPQANVENPKQKIISPLQVKQNSRSISSSNIKTEVAIAQLSKQLADIEELREVNQAQVNHVLRFLLSRVCSSTHLSQERLNEEPVLHNKEDNSRSKETSPVSHSASSDSSRYSVAYDSLSRFLETYKRAAEQSMLAKKRASVRRQQVALKQKKDNELLQNASENHLLIGPLRQTSKSTDKESVESELDIQDRFSCSTPSSLHSPGKACTSVGNGCTSGSILQIGTEHDANGETNSCESQENSSSISPDSLKHLPSKVLGDVSGEEYEDDWEEEETDGKHKQDEAEEKLADPTLQTIVEVEEKLSSDSENIENQKLHGHQTSESNEVHVKNSNITPINTFEKVTLYPKDRIVDIIQENNCKAKDGILLTFPQEITQPENVPSQGEYFNKTEGIGKDFGNTAIYSKRVEKSVVVDNIGKPKEVTDTTDCFVGYKRKHNQPTGHQQHHRTQAGHSRSCSSSSEAEAKFDSAIGSSRRWDLRLREDLQLQSAILLNWQLEDRWKRKASEESSGKLNTQTAREEVNVEVEKRWQDTLDQLDQRLKAVEENERISRIASEIRAQSREEHTKSLISNAIKNVAQEEFLKITDKLARVEIKASSKEQMVQTLESYPKNDLSLPKTEFCPSKAQQWKSPLVQEYWSSHFGSGQQPLPSNGKEDLTAELLAYTRMGILSNCGYSEQMHSKSSTSSTASSHFQHSSLMVSLSDGEMRDSASGSCSCSEGEFCVCGGRRLCSERAPPDGSQTFSDGENFLKDLSQGEIIPSEADHTAKDTSHGEISGHFTADVSPLLEETSDSDIEWEIKDNPSTRIS